MTLFSVVFLFAGTRPPANSDSVPIGVVPDPKPHSPPRGAIAEGSGPRPLSHDDGTYGNREGLGARGGDGATMTRCLGVEILVKTSGLIIPSF